MDSELKLRVDVMTGGMLAQTTMLMALISTHPDPARLQAVFRVFRERAFAAALNFPYGEGSPEGFAALADQLEEQLRICQETSGARSA